MPLPTTQFLCSPTIIVRCYVVVKVLFDSDSSSQPKEEEPIVSRQRQSSSNYYLNTNFMLVENSFWESEVNKLIEPSNWQPATGNRQPALFMHSHDLIAKRL